jgi:hypothetical protein
MTKKPTKPKVHNVATRLFPEEYAALVAYRDRHGLTSLNGAVRHWLKGEALCDARAKVTGTKR